MYQLIIGVNFFGWKFHKREYLPSKLVAERGSTIYQGQFVIETNGVSGTQRCNVGDTNFDYTDKEASFKLEKSRAKSIFTRLKRKLLFLVESEHIGTSRKVQEACENMDNGLEKAMDIMTQLSRFYMENEEKLKDIKIALESDKLEEDYNSAYKIARHYRRLLKGKQSVEKSDG